MTRASDNEYPSVLLDEQASAPTTPATGFWRVYAKSDGLYIVDDAGAETGPFGTGGGGSGALTNISTQTLASAGTITFSSIPSTHESLLIVGQLRSADSGTGGDQFAIRVGNGTVDSGAAAYGWTLHNAGSLASTEFSDTSDSEIEATGSISSDGQASGLFSAVQIRIPDYASTSRYRSVLFDAGLVDTASGLHRRVMGAGTWNNSSSAIDIIEVFSVNHASNHFTAGSSLTLYGVG